MILEFLVDAALEIALHRRDVRTRFQWGCLVSGSGLLLIGAVIGLFRGGWYGFAVAVVGSLLLMYGL